MSRELVVSALTIAAAAALGGVAGHATVSGMRADAVVTGRLAGAYGVPVKPADPLNDRLGYQTAAAPATVAGDAAPVEAIRYAVDCADC